MDLKCPACLNSSDPRHLAFVAYPILQQHTQGVRNPEKILFCPHCRLGIADPLFTEEEEKLIYEQGDYWKPTSSKINIRRLPVPMAMAQSRWKLIKLFLNQSNGHNTLSILDVGCGQGAFGLAAMRDPGIHLHCYTGVEPDGKMRHELETLWKYLKFPPILKLYSSTDSLQSLNTKFDLIVLSHIVEHLRAPQEILKLVLSMLSSTGLLFIEVPHQDHLFKPDVFPHVLFFNPESMRILLEKSGYSVQTVNVMGHSRDVNPLGKGKSILTDLSNRIMNHLSPILPLKISSSYYSCVFGPDVEDPKGIWIRTIAKAG